MGPHKLYRLQSKKTAGLVVIHSRKCIHKSALATEFARFFHSSPFFGLALESGNTAQDQRNKFVLRLSQYTRLFKSQFNDWIKRLVLLTD